METINNLATAASKAVFGEQKEPVSGVQGDVSKGEPYDAGNLATPAQEKYQEDPLTGTSNLKSNTAVSQQTPSTASHTQPISSYDQVTGGSSTTTTGRDTTFSGHDSSRTGHDSSLSGRDTTTGLNSSRTGHDSSISGRDNNLSSRDNTLSGHDSSRSDRDNLSGRDNISGHETTLPTREGRDTTTSTSTSHHNTLGHQDNDTASREDRVSGGNKDTTAGQNDTRDPEQVRNDSTKTDVDDKTPGATKPSDLKGPGPRPVETVAKEHGGDAGLNKPGNDDSTSRTENQREKGSESTEDKPKEHNGTYHSEEVVHASGFAADGGDFDATKPGAGQEADRLLDEKRAEGGAVGLPEKKSHTHGDSHGLGGHSSTATGTGSHGHDDKEKEKDDKPSLGERIKAKLHRH